VGCGDMVPAVVTSQPCQVSSKLVQGFWLPGAEISHFPLLGAIAYITG